MSVEYAIEEFAEKLAEYTCRPDNIEIHLSDPLFDRLIRELQGQQRRARPDPPEKIAEIEEVTLHCTMGDVTVRRKGAGGKLTKDQEIERLLYLLAGTTLQAAADDKKDSTLIDSNFMSVLADPMRELAKYGWFEIVNEGGRYVQGRIIWGGKK